MPDSSTIDRKRRRRFSQWVTYYLAKLRHQYPTDAAFARKWGISAAQLSRILHDPDRGIGSDVIWKFHDAFGAPLDLLADADPPKFISVDATGRDVGSDTRNG